MLPKLKPSKRSMKYALFDLTIAACVIAVLVHKLLLVYHSHDGLAPLFTLPKSQECEDGATSDETIIDLATPARGFLRSHAGYSVQDTVEVYDPKILESHAFFAKITNIVQYRSGKINFDITADIPSLSPNGQANNHFIFAEVDTSSVKPFEPDEFNTPITCDWSGGRYGRLLAPCRILSHEKNGDLEFYNVLTSIDDRLHYQKLPLSRIRRNVGTTSSAVLPNQFKHGMNPPYQMPIDGSTELLRGVAELYAEQSMFAEPVIILGYNDIAASPTPGYRAAYTISGTHYADVLQKFLHPYKIYKDGTKAFCNLDDMENEMDVQPCTILSHTEQEVGYLSYTVSYCVNKNEDNEKMMTRELSFSKVQRIRRDQAMM